MQYRGAAFWQTCAALAAVVSGYAHAASAMSANGWPGPQGDTWDSIKLLPDWSGAWGLDDDSFRQLREAAAAPVGNPNVPLLTPEFEKIRYTNNIINGGQGPDGKGVPTNSAKCIPDGMPLIMTAAYAHEYLFTPGLVTIIVEDNEIRRVHTDRRAHPEDPDLTFEGDSVGHWEGQTLVVDTVALKSRAMLVVGVHITEGTHVIERMTRIGPRTMRIETTVMDPRMFKVPYRYVRTYQRSDAGMVEYFCTENNRDSNSGEIDLTPPPVAQPAEE
jgi:hypothetical protein